MTDQTVSVLQLIKRRDADNSDVDSVDLLGLPTELQYQGWQQGLPQPNKPGIDEVITLLMNAGNYNILATALQSIDTKIKETEWAQDPLNPIGVWLRSRMTGETNARQSFITRLSRPQKGLAITSPLAYQGIVPDYNLGVTRMPTWENTLQTQVPASPGAITIHGGTIAYTLAGDAHARVAKVKIATASVALSETWLGVKSNQYGVNPTNFVPTWNMSQGSTLGSTSDTTLTADVTALSGTKAVCTFATTPTMTDRVIIRTSHVTANTSDQRGKYYVLLRAKTSDASLVTNVRVGNGYLLVSGLIKLPFSFSFQPRLQLSVANSGWKYYTLGIVKVPATLGISELNIDSAAIGIQAEKVSGTGNLELDCIVLIPAEHANHVIALYGVDLDLYLYTRPDGRNSSVVYNHTLSVITESPTPDAVSWAIPSGSGVIVCCGCGATGSAVADTFTPTLYVYPSYASLRGAA